MSVGGMLTDGPVAPPVRSPPHAKPSRPFWRRMLVSISAGVLLTLVIAAGSVLMIEPLLGGATTYQRAVSVDDPHAPPAATHIWTRWRLVLEQHEYTETIFLDGQAFGASFLRRYVRAGWPLRVLHGGDDSGDCVCGVEVEPGASHFMQCFPVGIYPIGLVADSLFWGGFFWMLLALARLGRESRR